MESKHASPFAEGSRQGHFFGFAFFTADFLAPFFTLLFEKPGRSFTRVTALAHERPRSLVIGHVLRRGHARNSERFASRRCARQARESPSDLFPSPRGDGVAAFIEFDVVNEGLDRFTR